MKKAIVSFLTVWVLVCANLIGLIMISPEERINVSAKTIIVDDNGTPGVDCNYTVIQWAIDNASDGDIIFVKSGTYFENVVVNITINLTGEDKNNTIIDGSGIGDVVRIEEDWVNVSGFTVTNCGYVIGDVGIKVDSNYNTFSGNNISLNNEVGIWFNESSNNRITDNTVSSNTRYGIVLSLSNNNTIIGNNVSNNSEDGIYLGLSVGNIITGNNVSNNSRDGICLGGSDRNIITCNNASNNEYGIHLYRSKGNSISNNMMVKDGIFINGELLEHWNTHNIDSANTVNEKPVYYFKNQTGGTVPLGAGQVILANCTYVIVRNQELTNVTIGIQLGFSSNNTIIVNNLSDIDDSIYLDSSSNNNITKNNITENSYRGIFLWSSSKNNIIKYNKLWNNNFGIYLYTSSNNNITGNNVTHNNIGINLQFSSVDNNITFNNISSNIGYGISVTESNNNSIRSNNISLNLWCGLALFSSSKNDISKNNLSNNVRGVILSTASNNDFIGNNVTSNYDGIWCTLSPDNNIIANNVTHNINYGIHLVQSSGNNITLNNFTNSSVGIYLETSSNNNVISDNNVINNKDGIDIESSLNNSIINNDIYSNNEWYGIYLYLSADNTLSNNTILDNANGIFFTSSSKNVIIGNNISNNGVGISIEASSHYNLIKDNNVSNINYGITITSSNGGKIIGNTISSNNEYGAWVVSSYNNIIYHNNFINNVNQAYDNFDNQWDSGYPIGGNYWDDYLGLDAYSGPNQDIPGSDGIGDTSYYIPSEGNEDKYPLMERFTQQFFENYTILKQGWNLISIPLIQENESLAKVLEMIDGYYDCVEYYNITDKEDHWKINNTGKPFGNDLTEITEKMSFWIHITKPGDTIFLYNGTQPTQNQTIQLYPGWNMVGYPSQTSYNRTDGLNNLTFDFHVDSIWTYNPTSQGWVEIGPSDYFEVGRGYWIHAKTKCKWEVPI